MSPNLFLIWPVIILRNGLFIVLAGMGLHTLFLKLLRKKTCFQLWYGGKTNWSCKKSPEVSGFILGNVVALSHVFHLSALAGDHIYSSSKVAFEHTFYLNYPVSAACARALTCACDVTRRQRSCRADAVGQWDTRAWRGEVRGCSGGASRQLSLETCNKTKWVQLERRQQKTSDCFSART